MNYNPHTQGPMVAGECLGFFNWSVEEKIAQWVLDNYSAISAEYTKAELYAMAKPLLGMYQQGVLDGTIPVFDYLDESNVQDVNGYLLERSQLPYAIVVSFTRALWELTRSGTLELKHLDPIENKTTAVTTKILPTMDTIKSYTPKALTSVLDMDVPAVIQKNLLLITILGISATALVIVTKTKGAPRGRTS